MLITRFINHIHVMYFLRAQYIGCYLFCPLSVNKMHSSSQASVHGCGSTSATPSDFLHFSRISVNFPLIAVPSTPFGVPGNFSKHAAVNKTRNYIQSIYAKILCILTLKQITVESTIMDKSRQQKPRISISGVNASSRLGGTKHRRGWAPSCLPRERGLGGAIFVISKWHILVTLRC